MEQLRGSGCSVVENGDLQRVRSKLDKKQRHPQNLAAVIQVAQQVAEEARARLEQKARRIVVHFDVDVIDFVDFPIADVPQFNVGLTFEEAISCLSVFAASERFGGLVITEFNPDNTDEVGVLTKAFVQGVARVLAQDRRT